MTEEEERHAVRRALDHLAIAKHALRTVRGCFPDDHPTADDELSAAFRELDNIRTWLERT